MTETETPLFGGLQNQVVRVGDTVRRPAGPWTPTIQALLGHLRAKGFPCPAPLGLDDKGREVVGFLEGRASNWPWPPALLAAGGAAQIAGLLSAYHAAVSDFRPEGLMAWRHGSDSLSDGQIVLHGDFGPHNLIWTGGRLAGVIDFELARPGQPLEDVGFAVIRAAFLRPDDRAARVGFDAVPDRRARLDAFAEGYGCPVADLLDAALGAQHAELDRIERLGGAGVAPWTAFRDRGLGREAALELAWLEENLPALARA